MDDDGKIISVFDDHQDGKKLSLVKFFGVEEFQRFRLGEVGPGSNRDLLKVLMSGVLGGREHLKILDFISRGEGCRQQDQIQEKRPGDPPIHVPPIIAKLGAGLL